MADIRLFPGEGNAADVRLRDASVAPAVPPQTNVVLFPTERNPQDVRLSGPVNGAPDKPYQTGVRSRRPFTGVVFMRGAGTTQAVVFAKAASFVIASLVAERAPVPIHRGAHTTFLRAPLVQQAAPAAKANQPVIATLIPERTAAGRHRIARVTFQHAPVVTVAVATPRPTIATLVPERAPVARRIARTTFLRAPDITSAGTPDKPYQTGVRSRRPFTGVVFMHGSPDATPPPAARAVAPRIVSLVGQRAQVRRAGRVVFQRELPANFVQDGTSPIVTVVQQSRTFFRRPATRVVFSRTAADQTAAPAAKTPGPTIVGAVAGEAREARARATDFTSSAIFLRNPAKDGNTRPQNGQITVVSLVPERAARRPRGAVFFERTPVVVPAAKGTQPTIATLVPERAARRPRTSITFARAQSGLAIAAKGTQPTIATLVPERSSRRAKTKSLFVRRQLVTVTGVSFPCYVVTLQPRATSFALSARPAVVKLSPRDYTFQLTARPATTKLLPRQSVFNIDRER